MAKDDAAHRGAAELRAARAESRWLYWSVAIFSFFVNTLMLTGPMYMLNVYDRVLGSRSVETLPRAVGPRGVPLRLHGGARLRPGPGHGPGGRAFQARLDRRVFSATLRAPSLARAQRESQSGLRDLEAVQKAMTSPALMSFFDLPFAPDLLCGDLHLPPLARLPRRRAGAVS
jgi:ATP-binding cassette subfamily C protein